MVDLTMPETDMQQQKNTKETDSEGKKEKRQNLLNVDEQGARIYGRSTIATQDPHYDQKNHGVETKTFFWYKMNDHEQQWDLFLLQCVAEQKW